MDACEHEYESMSRHNRKVPTSFYYRFARDTCSLSDEYAKGRVISVLEGGYSDRALTSGAMAHLTGLVDVPPTSNVDEGWWSVDNLIKVGTSSISAVFWNNIATSWSLQLKSDEGVDLHFPPTIRRNRG